MRLEMYNLRWPALWLAIAWSFVSIIVYLSLAPTIEMPLTAEGSDKYAHVAAYAMLMFWFMQIYGSVRSRVATAAGLASLGIGLEVLQSYTGYRTFEYADMAANVAGVVLGWLIAPPRTPNVVFRIEALRSNRSSR